MLVDYCFTKWLSECVGTNIRDLVRYSVFHALCEGWPKLSGDIKDTCWRHIRLRFMFAGDISRGAMQYWESSDNSLLAVYAGSVSFRGFSGRLWWPLYGTHLAASNCVQCVGPIPSEVCNLSDLRSLWNAKNVVRMGVIHGATRLDV